MFDQGDDVGDSRKDAVEDDNIGVDIGDAGEDQSIIFYLEVNFPQTDGSALVAKGFGFADNPLDFEVRADSGEKDDFHGRIIS